MGKKTVFIAWRFKESNVIELENQTLIAFKTNADQLISPEDLQQLLSQIDSIQEHLYLFLHKPNFDGNYNANNVLESLKRRKDKTKCIYVTEFHGGNHPIYREFINQGDSTLRTITNEDAERKLNACIIDPVLEALIHLYKTLSLTILKQEVPNFEILKNDFKYEDAFKLLNQESIPIDQNDVTKILEYTLTKIQERFKIQ